MACGGLHTIAPGQLGELKRMWVHDDWRGAGLGSRLLRHLEDQARALGHGAVRLDTNAALTEAIGMYQRAGYRAIGRYNDNPWATHFFEKRLSATTRNFPATPPVSSPLESLSDSLRVITKAAAPMQTHRRPARSALPPPKGRLALCAQGQRGRGTSGCRRARAPVAAAARQPRCPGPGGWPGTPPAIQRRICPAAWSATACPAGRVTRSLRANMSRT